MSAPTDLEVFKKLPLGGIDRRALVGALAKDGLRVATELLEAQRKTIRGVGTRIAEDTAVLILGGSNGITRALAVQLLFGERAKVYAVHFDSEKMQIGGFHVQAITRAAPSSRTVSAAAHSVPAVSIMSSTRTAVLPSTSPTT